MWPEIKEIVVDHADDVPESSLSPSAAAAAALRTGSIYTNEKMTIGPEVYTHQSTHDLVLHGQLSVLDGRNAAVYPRSL